MHRKFAFFESKALLCTEKLHYWDCMFCWFCGFSFELAHPDWMICLAVVAQMASFLWCKEWLKPKALLLRPLRLTFCKWNCGFINADEITQHEALYHILWVQETTVQKGVKKANTSCATFYLVPQVVVGKDLWRCIFAVFGYYKNLLGCSLWLLTANAKENNCITI